MRILVTGGSGYLARNITPKLIELGHEVEAPPKSELDILNSDALHDFIYKFYPEIIIHTAIKGGDRDIDDTFESTYIPNMKMFENICANIGPNIKVINIGSGAEFDRRNNISNTKESDIFNQYPIDPYGLSKNLISRKALVLYPNIYTIRLFGCFNENENDTRFIKKSILNVKNNIPIEIHQNKYMDFIYLDDLVTIINYVIFNPMWRDINAVYDKKYTLLDVADIIASYMPTYSPKTEILDKNIGKSYTGSYNILYREIYKKQLSQNFIGLHEGIRRTIEKLK